MKSPVRAITAAAAADVALPAHALLILASTAAALSLVLCLGIALPAVWSTKPGRRKAAADVLRQLLDACAHGKRR